MTAEETDSTLPPLPVGPVQGRFDFEEAVRLHLEHAAKQGWQRLCWMDADFSDWPLGERRVHDALQAWSRTGRKMVLLARRYDLLIARHHRFVSWRRQWAHIVECWQCPSADETEFPSLLMTPAWALRRLDVQHGNGLAWDDPAKVRMLDDLRELWQGKSTPGFPANVLGL